MKEKIEQLKKEITEKLSAAKDAKALDAVRVEFMGKTGKITALMTGLKDVPQEERKTFGQAFNTLKEDAERQISAVQTQMEAQALEKEMNQAKSYDASLPPREERGSLHPITLVQKEVEDIFKSMGFTIEDGNEIETEFNNFDAVNVPKNHPARDMQDTFWLENGQVLKTHTSAAQNRILKKYGAPLKAIFPGRCFRNENIDASHENTFFQIEGMMVAEDTSIANLIYFMKEMLSKVFGYNANVRLRPGYFPFVEPGFELDISCPFCGGSGCKTCKNGGWIELCPCGMIHPNVLEMGGVDSKKYQGFAFGLGLTRLAMMKFRLSEIRHLNSGNLNLLSQVGLTAGKKEQVK